MSSTKLFIILGRSASGKTSVANSLVLENIGEFLTSYTTREMRDNEEEGKDYYFVSKEEFDNIEMAASFEVSSQWKYGNSINEMLKAKKINLFFPVISMSYGLKTAKAAKDLGIDVEFLFFDLPREERHLRLKARGDSEESIINRFKIEDNEGEIDISEANEFKTHIFSENLSPENYLLKIKKEVFE